MRRTGPTIALIGAALVLVGLLSTWVSTRPSPLNQDGFAGSDTPGWLLATSGTASGAGGRISDVMATIVVVVSLVVAVAAAVHAEIGPPDPARVGVGRTVRGLAGGAAITGALVGLGLSVWLAAALGCDDIYRSYLADLGPGIGIWRLGFGLVLLGCTSILLTREPIPLDPGAASGG